MGVLNRTIVGKVRYDAAAVKANASGTMSQINPILIEAERRELAPRWHTVGPDGKPLADQEAAREAFIEQVYKSMYVPRSVLYGEPQA